MPQVLVSRLWEKGIPLLARYKELKSTSIAYFQTLAQQFSCREIFPNPSTEVEGVPEMKPFGSLLFLVFGIVSWQVSTI